MQSATIRNLLIAVCALTAATYTLGPWIWLCFGRLSPTYRVTFDVSDNGRVVYFTDWNGKAGAIDLETKHVSEINLCGEPVSAIRISRDGKRLTLSTEPKDETQHPEVIVALRTAQGEWAIEHRFRGMYPCFSHDGDQVFYCRSARSVVAGAFNGVLWSDTTLWKYDLTTKKETEISSQAFRVIDDIEHDATQSRLIFSAEPIDPNAPIRSNLFDLSLKTNQITQLTNCPKDCTCGSAPSISEDGKTLAYISDRDEPYRYKVIIENLKEQTKDVFDPSDIRDPYSTLPRIVGKDCYVLNAESFTANAQPRFRLIAFDRQGNWRVLVGQELLSP